MIRISPSILAADFSKLGAEASRMQACGAEMLHLDVMDGVFVPNLSFGAPIIRAIRPYSTADFDVHLMICDPIRYIDDFAAAGADSITFHIEAVDDPQAVIDSIHKAGCRAAISIKPATPVETVYPYLPQLDMVLIMTVEPGFGGQAFMPEMLEKIRALRSECTKRGLNTDIEVDGGIGKANIGDVAAAGANVFVAGSAVFRSSDAQKTIAKLRRLAQENEVL